MNHRIESGILPGGSEYEVRKAESDKYYYALVKLNGRYPEPGSFARNTGRDEFIQLLEGNAHFTLDGVKGTFETDEPIWMRNGSEYAILGQGKFIVFVRDQEGGRTEIIADQ